jgi:glycosyltransferase involved in cell wall biosynthesis
MKVLYVCADQGVPVLGSKGSAVHVRAMVRALRLAGNALSVAAPVLTKSPWEAPAPLEASLLHIAADPGIEPALAAAREFSEALANGVGVFPSDLRRILYNRELGKQLRRRFADDPPDFIYERASLYATAGVSVAASLGRPLLVELNAPLAMEQATYRASALHELATESERWTLTRADAVLVVSGELREYALGLGVEPDRVHVIPNGVDLELFHPGPTEQEPPHCWGLRDGPVLGFVGSLRPWHGVEVLPELLEQLLPSHPRVQLMIVGDGPLRQMLESEVRARGLSSSVIFTGALAQQEVASLVRHFDVALAPYPLLEHAFYFSPLKLFEYMASGVAVAAPSLGQIAEILRHRETGLLYPPGDTDALVQACQQLLEDPDLRTRLGSAAAEDVRERYAWGRNAERVMAIASSLRSNPGAPV